MGQFRIITNSKKEKTMFQIKNLAAAAAAALSLVAVSAHAALPATVTTALADMQTDGATLAGAFLVVAITIGAVKVLRKGSN